jgi:DNA-binding transcriptional regulator YiaG
MEARIVELEAQVIAAKTQALEGFQRGNAADKIRQGANLTRPEAAAYIGVSTRKLQRMEASGAIRRCSAMGTLVRYASRDVLRLASANGKEF